MSGTVTMTDQHQQQPVTSQDHEISLPQSHVTVKARHKPRQMTQCGALIWLLHKRNAVFFITYQTTPLHSILET